MKMKPIGRLLKEKSRKIRSNRAAKTAPKKAIPRKSCPCPPCCPCHRCCRKHKCSLQIPADKIMPSTMFINNLEFIGAATLDVDIRKCASNSSSKIEFQFIGVASNNPNILLSLRIDSTKMTAVDCNKKKFAAEAMFDIEIEGDTISGPGNVVLSIMPIKSDLICAYSLEFIGSGGILDINTASLSSCFPITPCK